MRLRRRPVRQTLVALVAVFALQSVVGLRPELEYWLFVLDGTVATRPWTLITSVYAHAGLTHLLANSIGLLLAGTLVARRTKTAPFHAFFVATGSLAGLAEVLVGDLLGPAHAVFGASGGVLALLGYLLAGNAVSTRLLDRLTLSTRAQVTLFAAVVIGLTLLTSGPRSAIVGHATGLACGLVAGRLRLLDTA